MKEHKKTTIPILLMHKNLLPMILPPLFLNGINFRNSDIEWLKNIFTREWFKEIR